MAFCSLPTVRPLLRVETGTRPCRAQGFMLSSCWASFSIAGWNNLTPRQELRGEQANEDPAGETAGKSHADQLSIHCQATVLAAIDMSWVFFIPEEIKARAMATAEASRAASEYAIR